MKTSIKYSLCLLLIRMQIAGAAPIMTQPTPLPPADKVAPVTTDPASESLNYPDILSAKSFMQAKKLIENSRARTDLNFSSNVDEAAFEQLIQAYVTVQWIDNGPGFTNWWKQNKSQLIRFAPAMGASINWESFLTNIMLAYNAEKKTPTEYVNWMQRVLSNPVTAMISHTTTNLVTLALVFVGGVTYASVVNGPITGTLNQWIKPLLDPLQQKAGTNGVKVWGALGKKEIAFLFKPKIVTLEETRAQLRKLQGVVYDGDHFKVSPEQLTRNMAEFARIWSDVNNAYNQIPEAYRSGRSVMADVAIFRPADFAMRLTGSMSASDASRDSAWAEIGRIQQRTGQYDNLEKIGVNLTDLLGEQNIAVRSGNEEGAKEIQRSIEALRSEIEGIGASPRQAGLIIENLRISWMYRQQSAGIIASKMFHDFNYSDVTVEVGKVMSTLQDNYATKYFTAQLAGEVSQICEQLNLSLDLQIKALEDSEIAANARKPALAVVRKMTKSAQGQRALTEPSNLESAKPESLVETLHEGAVKAVRR